MSKPAADENAARCQATYVAADGGKLTLAVAMPPSREPWPAYSLLRAHFERALGAPPTRARRHGATLTLTWDDVRYDAACVASARFDFGLTCCTGTEDARFAGRFVRVTIERASFDEHGFESDLSVACACTPQLDFPVSYCEAILREWGDDDMLWGSATRLSVGACSTVNDYCDYLTIPGDNALAGRGVRVAYVAPSGATLVEFAYPEQAAFEVTFWDMPRIAEEDDGAFRITVV